jgi:hypothetical protein
MRGYGHLEGKSIRIVGYDRLIFHIFSNDTTTLFPSIVRRDPGTIDLYEQYAR